MGTTHLVSRTQAQPSWEPQRLFFWLLPQSRGILMPTPSARWPMASQWPMPMLLAIPTMSALSLESATLAMATASMESVRLTLTPLDKWLLVFPLPMLMPPDTLTMLVLSPELATATATEQESTTASAKPRRTLLARWPTVVPEELSPVLTTATDVSLATEPLETVGSALLDLSTDKNRYFFQAENIKVALSKKKKKKKKKS